MNRGFVLASLIALSGCAGCVSNTTLVSWLGIKREDLVKPVKALKPLKPLKPKEDEVLSP